MMGPLAHHAGLWHAHRAMEGLRYVRAFQMRQIASRLDDPLGDRDTKDKYLKGAALELEEAKEQARMSEEHRLAFRRATPRPANDPKFDQEA